MCSVAQLDSEWLFSACGGEGLERGSPLEILESVRLSAYRRARKQADKTLFFSTQRKIKIVRWLAARKGIPRFRFSNGTCYQLRTELDVRMAMANDYQPPTSPEELIARYARGERHFPNTELNDADLSGVTLDGASFEKLSWFSSANFDGGSLRGTSFQECNVKCASFRGADLTGASFRLAAVEATDFDGAVLDGASFVGATCYGYTVKEDDEFPPSSERGTNDV